MLSQRSLLYIFNSLCQGCGWAFATASKLKTSSTETHGRTEMGLSTKRL